MKLRVISCMLSDSWYKNNIGDVFEIEHIEKSFTYKNKKIYRIVNGNGKGVHEDDCDLVPEKEEYPTIKENYF